MSIIQAFPAGAGGGTSDYTDLENKPQVAGVTLSGNKTLSELGIQPAEAGKGLSTEDYTTAEKTKLANITIDIDNKVDKIEGKGLSTEDYTTIEKNKLAGLENYDDTAIKGRVKAIEDVVPSGATTANKLATISDVEGIASDYDTLKNKPQIAGVTLSGNKTLSDLGIQASESGKGLSTNDYSDAEKEKVTNANTHLSTSVTDADGVHGFKVTTGNSTKIFYKLGNDWNEITLGDVTQSKSLPAANESNLGKIFQYIGNTTEIEPIYKHGYFYECIGSEEDGIISYSWEGIPLMDVQEVQKNDLPQPSINELGNIYQYIGNTTENYVKGYYYECIKDGSVYKWAEKKVQSGGGQIIQYDTMPTADGTNVNKIIQYVGNTTSVAPIYTNGYFYKCVEKEENSETVYVWENKLIQQGGDTRIGDEITNIKVRFDDGIRPYISVDLVTIIPEFSEASIEDILLVTEEYYNGTISLEEIQEKWHVGDSTDMAISAMAATGVGETHAAQTVAMKILDFNHDTMSTSINDKTKSLLTLGFKLAENGVYGSPLGGWSASARRTWCNNVVLNALPSNLKASLKSAKRKNGSGGNPSSYGESGDNYSTLVETSDKIYIPNIKEYTGSIPVPYRGATDATNSTQFELFKTSAGFGLGDILSCSACKEYRSSDYNYHRHILYAVNNTGGAYVNDMNTARGIFMVLNI